MIAPVTKRFFKACLADDEFQIEMKLAEGDRWVRPRRFMSDPSKIVYASVYAGWLVGKGRIEKFKNLDT